MKSRRFLLYAVLVAAIFSVSVAGAQTYTAQRVDPGAYNSKVTGMNNLGQLVGYTEAQPANTRTGFFWSEDTGLVPLRDPANPAALLTPWGIDDSGLVFVTSNQGKAYTWTQKDGLKEIALSAGPLGIQGLLMTSKGTVLLRVWQENGGFLYYTWTQADGAKPYTGLPAGFTIGSASPNGHLIAWNTYSDGSNTKLLYLAGTLESLKEFMGPIAPSVINDKGLIYGTTTDGKAGFYNEKDGFREVAFPQYHGWYAMNSQNVMVGERYTRPYGRPVVWTEAGGVKFVSDILTGDGPVPDYIAGGRINDSGHILIEGVNAANSTYYYVLLTPVRPALRNSVDVVMASPTGAGYLNGQTGKFVTVDSRAASQCAAGNFDNDGVDDLVCVFPEVQGVQVQNSSTGTWGTLSATNPRWIAVGDMDGDGRDDLIGSWDDAGAVYWRNSVSGEWTRLSATRALMVAVGNFDGDAAADLVGVWDDNPGVWVRNSSDSSWGKIAETNPKWIAVGDMNGDGRDDLVGSWDDAGAVYWRDSVSGAWERLSETPADRITAGDLDGDGKADIIGCWPYPAGVWARLSGSGEWRPLYGGTPVFLNTGTLHR